MIRPCTILANLSVLLVAGCGLMQTPEQRQDLTSLASAQQPVLRTEFPATGTQSSFSPWGQNGDTITWVSSDAQISLAFSDGVLVSTRGLSADLMSADVTSTRAALQGGPRSDYTTFRSYLDDQGETLFRSYICSLNAGPTETLATPGHTTQVARFNETCASLTGEHTNSYWIGGDGTMWRSRQWIGDDLGYLATDRLVK